MENKEYMYDSELKTIIKEFNRLLYKVSLDLVKNKEEAENAVQDTYLAYYKNIDRYINLPMDDKRRLLARIAINKCKDMLKSKANNLTDKSKEIEKITIARDYKIEEKLIDKEKYTELIKALNEMKDPYRKLINDYYINDLCLDELALKYNSSKATIKVQITRGKQILKENLIKGGDLFDE